MPKSRQAESKRGVFRHCGLVSGMADLLPRAAGVLRPIADNDPDNARMVASFMRLLYPSVQGTFSERLLKLFLSGCLI
jgi:hypothetical protein